MISERKNKILDYSFNLLKKYDSNLINDYIKDKNFNFAYFLFQSQENNFINFMKEVIKIHGTNSDCIKSAINVITNYENESPEFASKLLHDTLNTEEYKKAFGRKKSKDLSSNTISR